MTIYLDVILFENILMNLLIIYTSNYLNRSRVNIFRMFISSIIGAVYYIAILLPQTSFLNFYIYKIVLSVVMTLIGFEYKEIYSYIKCLGIFYFTSFIYGGIAYGIGNLFSKSYSNYYSIKIILVTCILAFIFIKKIIKTIKNNMYYSNYDYYVDIYIDNKIKKIKAFLDTGNNMRDPITNKPVLIVSLESIKDILPQEIVLNKNIDEILLKNKNVKLLPYISVGNSNGLMLGYKTDKIKIYINKEERILKDIIVGINNTKLGRDSNFDALLSIDLLNYEGGRLNGKVTV